MQLVLDIASTEAAPEVEKLMVTLAKNLHVELHKIIVEYEAKLAADTGSTHFVLKPEEIVNTMTRMVLDEVRRVLQRSYVIPSNGWDTINELGDRIGDAFAQASQDFEAYVHLGMHETFVACQDTPEVKSMVFQMESLTDIFKEADTTRVDQLLVNAKGMVVAVCRREMEILLTRIQRYVLPNGTEITQF